MSGPIQISLKAGERIYLNGAVVRADRKVTLQLLNDVIFILESHVMQANETTTPLRQLYFVVQALLMDPRNAEATRNLFYQMHASTMVSFANETVRAELAAIARLVGEDSAFEALKRLRALFPSEDAILARLAGQRPSRAA
jgi:flagellar biosynthesis repressor protein FlbT